MKGPRKTRGWDIQHIQGQEQGAVGGLHSALRLAEARGKATRDGEHDMVCSAVKVAEAHKQASRP